MQDAPKPAPRISSRAHLIRPLAQTGAAVALCAMVALSAIITKEAVARSKINPLAAVTEPDQPPQPEPAIDQLPAAPTVIADTAAPAITTPVVYAPTPDTRYFNARPVRPARTISMLVTAYSPDARSCGPSADGITSSVHSVQTNAMNLVAADTRILPLGSMISVPGYDEGRIVPVLDRGGKIKGKHLDVLFPTDAAARAWAVRRLEVTIWEYADNLPADDFRAIRDSRN